MAVEDKRLTAVKTEEKNAINEHDKKFGQMIGNTDKFYRDQVDAANKYKNEQMKLQDQQTDFAIEKIEQQKSQAKKDYTKEQSGAYVDWQKQSNAYGANAEKRASAGLNNDGYSESSQVSMYNTYQNRVATAREVFNQAILNYNNSITEARLQNNVAKAKIAYETLQKTLELALEGFQYKNTLILEQAKQKRDIQAMYQSKYKDVLNQINTEKSLAEEIRQFNAKMEEDKRQFNEAQALEREKFNWQKAQAAKSGSGGGSGGIRGSSSGSKKKSGGSSGSSSSIKGSSSTGSSSKSKTKGTGVDMDSVISLGYGPISASKLNDLVEKGKVEEIKEGGTITFKRTDGFVFDKYGPKLR